MSEAAKSELAADRQKAKVLTFFCVLGLAGFVINLLAGYALWAYNRTKQTGVPTYDTFVFEMNSMSSERMPAMATDLFEKWTACATSQAGWTQVTTHALITSSVIGAALFAVSSILAWQIYRRLSALHQSLAPPQPPDAIDES
ncbi:MAG: hypothetical protein EXR36_08225 [Betaproteobacteria bacterium]|nr:hypothetical protein [Betaproteobacteria bacterium]